MPSPFAPCPLKEGAAVFFFMASMTNKISMKMRWAIVVVREFDV